MKFSEELWKSCTKEVATIVAQKFNQELARGTLSKDRFMYYIEQDVLYLNDYARALAFLAARAEDKEEVEAFLRFANGALLFEQAVVHEYYAGEEKKDTIKERSIGYTSRYFHAKNNEFVQITPACLGYTNYLLRLSSTAPVEVAMAAILPCPWVYVHVGKEAKKISTKNNPYRHWIDSYANEEAINELDKYIAIVDAMAERTSPAIRLAMKDAFKKAVIYEYYFWEDSYSFAKFEL